MYEYGHVFVFVHMCMWEHVCRCQKVNIESFLVTFHLFLRQDLSMELKLIYLVDLLVNEIRDFARFGVIADILALTSSRKFPGPGYQFQNIRGLLMVHPPPL